MSAWARAPRGQSQPSRLAERRNAFPPIHEFHFMLSPFELTWSPSHFASHRSLTLFSLFLLVCVRLCAHHARLCLLTLTCSQNEQKKPCAPFSRLMRTAHPSQSQIFVMDTIFGRSLKNLKRQLSVSKPNPPFNSLTMKNFLLSLSLCFADVVGVRLYAGQPEALVFLLLAFLAFPLFLLSAVNLHNTKSH